MTRIFAGLLLAATWGATGASAAAAPPQPPASSVAVAASAPRAPDTIAQRVLACTGCHGAQGRASSEGYYPRIAGKPAGYLYDQLLNFRDGRRRNARMTYLVDYLSDAYLREMAEHFASLDLPYPRPAQRVPAPAVAARGEQLVRHGDPARELPACATCHGDALMGRRPATPGLLALPRDYLIAQLGRWKSGLRRSVEPDCMAQIARKLTPQDVDALSNWLAAQPVPAEHQPAAPPAEPPPLRCGTLSEAAR